MKGRVVVRYQVWQGVDRSHSQLKCAGYFEKLQYARELYDSLHGSSLPLKSIERLEFPRDPVLVASKANTIAKNWE